MTGNQAPQRSMTMMLSLLFVLIILASIMMLAGKPDYKTTPLVNKKVVRALFADAAVKNDVSSMAHSGLVQSQGQDETLLRFQQAVAMLHAKQYDYAVKALQRVITLAPRMPEAYVNMGFAYLGLEDYQAARDYFALAADISAYQANAYWGLANALEKLGDVPGALGAMRTFLHLTPPDDPYVRRARAALWEWEEQLGRGPLPADELAWKKKKEQAWEDRNSPELDGADDQQSLIPIRPIQ